MIPRPITDMFASHNVSSWIGTTVVTPDHHVEGEINEVVIDSVTGRVKYFVVAIGDEIPGRVTTYALPFNDCQFDEQRALCIARAMYPLRM